MIFAASEVLVRDFLQYQQTPELQPRPIFKTLVNIGYRDNTLILIGE